MFAPCPSCRRHVRIDDSVCPFCGSSIASRDATPDATTRMSRARLFVFATTVGVTAATLACPSGGGIAQPYGAPPREEHPAPETGPTEEQQETSAIAPPATIEPPPGPAPTIPNTAPTTKPTYAPGPPVALYGAPAPPPNQPIP